MRFCMVTTFYPPHHYGGDAVHVQCLTQALAARGHHVEVVYCEDAFRLRAGTVDQRKREPDGLRRHEAAVHRIHSRFGPLSPLLTQQTGQPGLKGRQLRSILARTFDVVHFHNVSLIGGPGVLSLSRAAVTLYSLLEHWLLCPTSIFWKNRTHACDRPQCFSCCLRSGLPPQLWRYTNHIQRSLAYVDALLSPSRYTEGLHRAAGISRPIHVLPLFSGLPPAPPTPEPRRSGRARFLFVGRVTASKGIAELLEAFAARGRHELWIAGDGDLKPELERRYRQCEHIRWLGWREHATLGELYRGATALVLPSLAPESFGLCVVEAFAQGTPAIVRDAGASRELIDRTGGGFVYRTQAELDCAVDALAENVALREELGHRAWAGYQAHYTEKSYLAAYFGLIETIRESKSAPMHHAIRGHGFCPP